ncbi:hypothetical protein MMC24_004700 [Lignoscripta atroalba]|nr:hypothetical protein [Lignoscripta atroalba]
MVVLWLLKPDKTRFPSTSKDILGLGRTGVILRHGRHALKIARVEDIADLPHDERDYIEALNEMNCDALHNEIEVYKQLGSHPGIIQVFELSEESIEMAYAKEGSLSQFIKRRREPTDSVKARWISSIACTFSHIHKCRVTVDDVALRNFLIDEHLAIKLIDFGLSTRQPQDGNMTDIVAAQADIFRAGFIFYSIAAWKIYDYDEFEDGQGSGHESDPIQDLGGPEFQWPQPERLPSVNNCISGSIINKCWAGRYKGIDELCDDVWHELGALL